MSALANNPSGWVRFGCADVVSLTPNNSAHNAEVKTISNGSWPATHKCTMGIYWTAMGFEEIEHTADHALKVYGQNLKELFISAARGMTALMLADTSGVSGEIEKTVQLETIDTESLLVEWLSELAYWAEAEMLIFKTFNVRLLTARQIDAVVIGARATALDRQIKAVTYHNLNIAKTRKGVEATIVFDV